MDEKICSIHRTLQLSSVVTLCFLLFFLGCQQKKNENETSASPTPVHKVNFLNLDPRTQYVGDQICASCHSKLFNGFKQNGMGRSFYPASSAKRIEDVNRNNHIFDPRSHFHYEVIAKGKDLYQIEYRLDKSGKRTHELARKIDYIIGSGNHARTYITEENGFLFELPLTWYTQKKQWGLSPGYEVNNYRFSRPITAGCMNCHNSYSEYIPYSGNKFSNVPHGIGCERCHGPGELHVMKQSDGESEKESVSDSIDNTIVNPRHLSAEYQMDVCSQCHLSGMVGIPKSNKVKKRFRPGMRLKEIQSVFVLEDPSSNDLRVASHSERLSLSECYTKSNGKLVCTTCHNPHQAVKNVPRKSFNEPCLQCHAVSTLSTRFPEAQHTVQSDCIRCHMPQGKTVDVVHTNFTEHWIQKKSGVKNVLQNKSAGTLKDFFSEKDDVSDLRLLLAYLQSLDGARPDRAYVESLLASVHTAIQKHPDNEEGLYRLGLAYSEMNLLSEAVQQFRQLIKNSPEHAQAHWQLAIVLQKMRHNADAIESLKNSLRIFPHNAPALTQLGSLYLQMNDPESALTAFNKSITVQPSYAEGLHALGEFYLDRRQDLVESRKYFIRVVQQDPDHLSALNNLGVLATAHEQYAESADYFLRVIALNDKNLQAYGYMALIRKRQGRISEARSYLQKALAIDPNNLRVQQMLKEIDSPNSTK